MSNYSIITDANIIDGLYRQIYNDPIPLSLERDYKRSFKKQKERERHRITRDLALEMDKPLNSFDKLKGISSQELVMMVKIRLLDPDDKKGKRGGYRCILLIDSISKDVLLLHVYKKSEKDDISIDEKKILKTFHESYLLSHKDYLKK